MSRKLRIVQRVADKQIFTWTDVLAKRQGFRSGTITVDEDGNTTRIELDQLGAADYQNLPGIPQREKALMEENQALQARLAVYEKGTTVTASNTANVSVDGVTLPTGDAGEEVVPEVLDLTDVSAPDELVIEFQPEPQIYTRSQLGRMTNEKLIAHAHDVKRTVDLPDDAVKRELVEICLELQTEYEANKEG